MWTAPVADDVLSELTPAEAAALQAALGGSTPEQKVTPILGHVVSEIQGYIRSGGYPINTADLTTIPDSLTTDAIVVTRWRLITSIPELAALQTAAREMAFNKAMAKLALVTKQKFAIEPPPAYTPTAAPTGNWNSENKIIMRTHPTPAPSTQLDETDTDYANPAND